MKKIFKLAAIAVSMALVTSLVACSSGDDDVVDTSTPEYLLNEQIDRYIKWRIESIDNYVASIEYNQNVSDKQIESLKKVHDGVMALLGDCTDCLEAYFELLKAEDKLGPYVGENAVKLSLVGIEAAKKELNYLKRCGTHEKCEKALIYMPAIDNALDEVSKAKAEVVRIGDINYPELDVATIVDGKLNERQAANMKAYTDAVEALKAALNDADKKTCKTTIEAADGAIKAFNELGNKNVSKEKIANVTTAVTAMYDDIETKVSNTFWTAHYKD